MAGTGGRGHGQLDMDDPVGTKLCKKKIVEAPLSRKSECFFLPKNFGFLPESPLFAMGP